MIQVVDRVDLCTQLGLRAPPPRRSEVSAILVHRLGATLDRWPHALGSAPDCAAAFARHPDLVAIGRLPYHLMIWPAWHGLARVEQGVTLSRMSPHALAWSDRSIGIALIVGRDAHQLEPPDPEQWELLTRLCVVLWRCVPSLSVLLGHSEAHARGPEATRDAAKAIPYSRGSCPGPTAEALLPGLRATVARVRAHPECRPEDGSADLRDYGLRW